MRNAGVQLGNGDGINGAAYAYMIEHEVVDIVKNIYDGTVSELWQDDEARIHRYQLSIHYTVSWIPRPWTLMANFCMARLSLRRACIMTTTTLYLDPVSQRPSPKQVFSLSPVNRVLVYRSVFFSTALGISFMHSCNLSSSKMDLLLGAKNKKLFSA